MYRGQQRLGKFPNFYDVGIRRASLRKVVKD